MSAPASTVPVRDDRPAAQSARRRSWPRRLLRGFVGLLLVLGLLAALGAGAQALVQHRNASEHPAPGQLVDVGGHRLHLHAEGPRGTGPTVVLEAGMGTPSTAWAWVQGMVADDVRVVSYDRAGIGWSDDRGGPVDPAAEVRDLRTALDAAGEEGPFVLVGHSLGGLFARTFAATYPRETAGVVLVDPYTRTSTPICRRSSRGRWTVRRRARF